jgi:hypothetical protein
LDVRLRWADYSLDGYCAGENVDEGDRSTPTLDIEVCGESTTKTFLLKDLIANGDPDVDDETPQYRRPPGLRHDRQR